MKEISLMLYTFFYQDVTDDYVFTCAPASSVGFIIFSSVVLMQFRITFSMTLLRMLN